MVEKSSQQRDLFESERSFRLLVEGVADYALYMLDPTGRITSWNIGGERIKGYSPGEILGQHFSRFYTETDRANGKPARALGIAREKGRYEEEGWRVRKDGTFFWASVVIDPIYEAGELVGFANITRDITERRNTQLKLEAMQKQLAESQKFDALGQLRRPPRRKDVGVRASAGRKMDVCIGREGQQREHEPSMLQRG